MKLSVQELAGIFEKEKANNSGDSNPSIDDLGNIFEKEQPTASKNTEKEVTTGERIGRFAKGVGTGATSLVDLIDLGGSRLLGHIGKILKEKTGINISDEAILSLLEHNPSLTKSFSDLYHKTTGYPERTPGEDIAGDVLEFGGSMASPIPGSGMVKAVKTGTGVVGKAANLAKAYGQNLAIGTGAEAAVHGLPDYYTEDDKRKFVENLAKGVVGGIAGGIAGGAAFSKAGSWLNRNPLSQDRVDAYRRSAEPVIGSMTGTEKTTALKGLKNRPTYTNTGYQPSTVELTESPNLAAAERSRAGASGSPPFKERDDINQKLIEDVWKAQETPSPSLTLPDENATGEFIRNRFENIKKREKLKRKEKSEPYYKKAEEVKEPTIARGTIETIDEILDSAGAESAEYLKSIKRQVGGKSKQFSPKDRQEKLKYELMMKQFKKYNPFNDEFHPFKEHLPEMVQFSKLNSVRAKVAKKLNRIEKDHLRGGEAHDLRETLAAIEADLSDNPAFAKARQVYRENSKVINVLEEHPAFKQILKKEHGYTDAYRMDSSKILDKLIAGKVGKNYSETALKLFEKHPKQLKTIQDGILNKFLEFTHDANGNINPSKINAFFSKNPGAKVLFKDIEKTIKDNNLITGTLVNDIYHNAIQGKTHRAFSKYLRKNQKVIETFLPQKSQEILKEIGDILEKRAKVSWLKSTVNSATMANASTLELLGSRVGKDLLLKIGGKIPGIKAVVESVVNNKKALTKEVIDRMLIEPNFAELMLSTPLKSKDYLKKFVNLLGKSNLAVENKD